MCGGVEARDAEKAYKVYFPSPKAAFPVMLEGGESLGWVRWGRRREEPGQGPQGGWARLETVERGGWEKYSPIRAYGVVQRYMEKDVSRQSHWFDMQEGFALDCLILGKASSGECMWSPARRRRSTFGFIIGGRFCEAYRSYPEVVTVSVYRF